MSQYTRYPVNGVPAPVSVANGGTGLIALGGANQILGANAGNTALEYKNLAGTTSQVVITQAPNLVTFSLPQSIATTSTPTFAKLTLTQSTALSAIALSPTLTVTGSATIDARATQSAINGSYSGSTGFLVGLSGTATTACTGIDLNNLYANFGLVGISNGTNTGLNIGSFAYAKSAAISTAGCFATDGDKANAKYIGVIGASNNQGAGGTRVGGYFTLKTLSDFVGTGAFPAVNAALIADNVSQTDDVFKCRDDGADTFRIMDGGGIGTNQLSAATTPGTVIQKMPIYNAAGTLIGYIPVYDSIT